MQYTYDSNAFKTITFGYNKKNMKSFLIPFIILMTHFVSSGQSYENEIKQIQTIDQANTFINANPNSKAKLQIFIQDIDASSIAETIYNNKEGYIFTNDHSTYKIIKAATTQIYRVSYIYLDGTKLTASAIKQRRKIILDKYSNGIPFTELARMYTMDGNSTGDLNWFAEGMMAKEFEDAVKQHKINDIFTIDIPERNWYYVTLKTFTDRKIKKITVLKVDTI